tara:strand:- start:606 stop:1340 length:735 start_codon:yes stop_codon:yes gene_type:complete
MSINYLSESLFIKDGITYFIDKQNIKKVTKYNWHNIMNSIGWKKLNINWIKKLNNLSENTPHNSLYGALDCGGDGDCFFNCIAHALNYKLDENNMFYTSSILRNLLAESISKNKYNEIIELYKIYYDNNELLEDWNPYETTYPQFIDIIKQSDFWGDYLLFNEFINLFKINIIILNVNTIDKAYNIYNTLHTYNSSLPTIILNYEDNMHFTLFGYFVNNKMVYLFTDDILPTEIVILIKREFCY